MNMIKILLVDDETLLLESLEIILTLNNMDVIGMAHDGNEALSMLREKECSLALVDLNMKGMGGIELISIMKNQYPDIKILVLTTFYDDKNITDAISGGADGYLLKDSGKDAILGAIEQIMGGRNVIDSRVMSRLAAIMSSSAKNETLPDSITEREKEVCSLLAQGLTNRQIAETLYISEGTVKNYISSIYEKTGIHDRAKLIVAIKG
ncbi:MAG: response regulator transcription factor [Ruminococcus sp.]|nr:response regulator transcription factor [Ruminococcus sp.]